MKFVCLSAGTEDKFFSGLKIISKQDQHNCSSQGLGINQSATGKRFWTFNFTKINPLYSSDYTKMFSQKTFTRLNSRRVLKVISSDQITQIKF